MKYENFAKKKQMWKFFGKNAKILQKKYGREMIDYGIMPSSQSSEFHKFFAQVIVAAMGFARTISLCENYFCEISHSFCIFSLNSFSRKNA